MQTLWTRAAQSTCICKCAFCRSTTALSRTTTSSALKRRIRFRDIFTVFYSTVLTSAAVADAYRKDARKKNWEGVIQAAKEEVAAIEEQQRRRIALLSLGFGETSEAAPSVEKTWLIENTWDKVFQSATNKCKARELLGFQDVVGPPLRTLRGLSAEEIRELLSDPAITRLNNGTSDADFHPAKWSRPSRLRPYSLKQVKRAEWSVRKLAYHFLLSCEEESPQWQVKADQKANESHSTSAIKQTILDRISTCERALKFIIGSPRDPLLWMRMRSPKVPSYARQIDHDAASLNDRLLGLFQSFEDSGTGSDNLLRSISTLLLFAPNPPDVHFYNMLIIGLCQMQQMTNVHAVIESMRECLVRPNATTLSAMLHYYAITQNKTDFRRLTGEMKGLQGGLFKEHPSRGIPPGLRDRYRTYEYSMRETAIEARDEELLYDQPRCSYLTPDGRYPLERGSTVRIVGTARMGLLDGRVYNALIDGSLELGLAGQAMYYYSQMISDGFRPERSLLESILKHSTRIGDWDAGVAVWKQLCRLAGGIDRIAIGLMLTLCHTCGNHIEYGQVFDYGIHKGLIPSASSAIPGEVTIGLTSNTLDTKDSIAFSLQPCSQWCIARDTLERAVELLAYQIAIVALDLATIDIDARWKSVGFSVYRRIKRLYRNSPAAISRRRAKPGGRGVFEDPKANSARPALQASCLTVSNAQSEVIDQACIRSDPSLGNEKMLPSPLSGKVSSSTNSTPQKTLAELYSAIVLSPGVDEVQDSAFDDVRDPESPFIDGEAWNVSIKSHAANKPLIEEMLGGPKSWDRTQTTLEEQEAQSQLMKKPPPILQVSEDGQRPKWQHKLQPSARVPVTSSVKDQIGKTVEAQDSKQSFLALVEQGTDPSDLLTSSSSISALIEWDHGSECLSNEESALELMRREQPLVGRLPPSERREVIQAIRCSTAENEDDREYTWRSYHRKLGNDGTLTSESTQTERSDENGQEGGEIEKLLPVDQPLLSHLREDTTQTSHSSTQPLLATMYREKPSNIDQHSTGKHTNTSLLSRRITDITRLKNGQYDEPSPAQKPQQKMVADELPRALGCNNHSTIRDARQHRRTLKGRKGKPRMSGESVIVSLELGESARLPHNSFLANKVYCSARRETQASNPEQGKQGSSWSPQSPTAKRKRSGHDGSVQWRSVLEEPDLSHPSRVACAPDRDPQDTRTNDEAPIAPKETPQPLLTKVRKRTTIVDTGNTSHPNPVFRDHQKTDKVSTSSASVKGFEPAWAEVENAASTGEAQSPVLGAFKKVRKAWYKKIKASPPMNTPIVDKALQKSGDVHTAEVVQPTKERPIRRSTRHQRSNIGSSPEPCSPTKDPTRQRVPLGKARSQKRPFKTRLDRPPLPHGQETGEARPWRHGSTRGAQEIATITADKPLVRKHVSPNFLVPQIRKHAYV